MNKSPHERAVREYERRALEEGAEFVPKTLLRGEAADDWHDLREEHAGSAADALRHAISVAVRELRAAKK